jgi:hypothetical protein
VQSTNRGIDDAGKDRMLAVVETVLMPDADYRRAVGAIARLLRMEAAPQVPA